LFGQLSSSSGIPSSSESITGNIVVVVVGLEDVVVADTIVLDIKNAVISKLKYRIINLIFIKLPSLKGNFVWLIFYKKPS
jgi:hypothetical protein